MTNEGQERADEEQADYEIGWEDRMACRQLDVPAGPDLVLNKGKTQEQLDVIMEQLWEQNRSLGPGWRRGWRAAHAEALARRGPASE